jgi:hypothetical protein
LIIFTKILNILGRVRIKKKIRNKNPALGDIGTLSNYGNIEFEVVKVEKLFISLLEITQSENKINVLVSKNRLIKNDDNRN